MSQPVLFEELATQNGRRIGVATLASEKTLNALSLDMVHLLTPQLRQWARDPEIAMVLLQAQGEKAFCAGGDLQKIYTSMREHHASPARDDIRGNQYAAEFFEHEYRLDYEIHTYPKPILCWGHGIVMGGGIGLMAGCSHRVVTERSRLAMPEITIGLYPDVGGSWFLSRTPGKLGAFLALTGALMNAEDAKFTGLADYRVAHADKQKVIDALLLQNWGDGDDAAVLGRVLQQAERDVAADVTFAASALRDNFEKNRGWLESSAQQASGRKITVVAVSQEAAPEPPAGTAPAPPDKKAELRKQAMADAGVQAMLEVFPAEIRDVEEI